MPRKTALVTGSTGLIGNALLTLLLQSDEYDKVIALVRKSQGLNHSKLVGVLVSNFD
ncbi:MAG: NAD-dependent epimerase/dehydratase family protein [Bacillus sp. (in: firmicutes)]